MINIAHFISLESQVWEALVAGDAQADQALLAADFLGVYPSGFSDRLGHADQLENGPAIARYEMSQARLLELGENRALLSYHADFTRVGHDVAEAMYVSSIWEYRDGAWLNTFSQDSNITEP